MAAHGSIAPEPASPAAAGWPVHAGRQWLVIAVVATLALSGLGIANGAFGGGLPVAGAGARSDTGFGWIAISGLETLGGLTPEDVGGMTHGISGRVPADSEEILVGIVLANTHDRRVRIDPAAFALSVADAAPLAPSGGTLNAVAIAPGARIEARLAFVVPRAAADAWLHYTDPDGHAVTLAAGRIDTGPAPDPAPSDERHDH